MSPSALPPIVVSVAEFTHFIPFHPPIVNKPQSNALHEFSQSPSHIVENHIIAFNPEHRKDNQTKSRPNHTNHIKLPWNMIGEDTLLPGEASITNFFCRKRSEEEVLIKEIVNFFYFLFFFYF